MNGVLLAIKLIDSLLLLAIEIPALFNRATALRAELQIFVDEDRDPNEAEWDTLNAETFSLLEYSQGRADAAKEHLKMMEERDSD